MKAAFTVSLVILAACMAGAQAVRFSGPPVSRSVRNESDAAIDRACAWIAARQDADGSWAGDPELTSVAVLALAGAGEELQGRERATVDRAVEWLSGAAVTNVSAAAWRDIALAVFPPSGGAAAPAPIPYSSAGTVSDALAIRERAAVLGIDDLRDAAGSAFTNDFVFALMCRRGSPASAADPGMARLAADALAAPTDSPGDIPPSEKLWWVARAVNLTLGGNLPADRQAIGPSWRSRLTSLYTNSQSIDGKGRGHWRGSLRDTAFAVLLLKEL